MNRTCTRGCAIAELGTSNPVCAAVDGARLRAAARSKRSATPLCAKSIGSDGIGVESIARCSGSASTPWCASAAETARIEKRAHSAEAIRFEFVSLRANKQTPKKRDCATTPTCAHTALLRMSQ